MDVVVQPDEPRWKRLLVSDMDSTIIGQECIDELADYAGLKDKVAQITERAMQGELDFSGALRERVRLLAGLDERALSRCLDERVHVTAGAETLVQTMRAGGASFASSSPAGSCPSPTQSREAVGFDRVKANRLVFVGGKLSGEVGDPIVDAMSKQRSIGRNSRAARAETRGRARVGDGANDKLMIEEAGLGIATRRNRRWPKPRKPNSSTTGSMRLLWVQGVRRKDSFRGRPTILRSALSELKCALSALGGKRTLALSLP